MNKKEKKLALSTAINSAVAENGVNYSNSRKVSLDNGGSTVGFVVEGFGEVFNEKPKTKEFIAVMKRWGLDPKEKAMFFMMEVDENVEKSGRNIGTLKMLLPRSLNIYDVLNAEKLVFTMEAVDYLNEMYGVVYEGEDDDEEVEDSFEVIDDGEEDETLETAE